MDQDALSSGIVSRAMSDVDGVEPAGFSAQVFKQENLHFTPYAAFHSADAHGECHRCAAMNITNYFRGRYDCADLIVKPG